MNKIILCGRVSTQINLIKSQTGMDIAKFNIAVDRRVKQGDEQTADFIDCVAFDKKATFINNYFDKGRRILITGRLQTSNYTDKDGNKRKSTEVIVEDVEFCDSKNSAENHTPAPAPAPAPKPDDDGFVNIADNIPEELPFE